MHIMPGDVFEAEISGDILQLHPQKNSSARLVHEGKRLVWDAPQASVSVEEVESAIQRLRSERDQSSFGL